MTCSPFRWVAAILLLAGVICPAICPAQVVMSFRDDDPSYPIKSMAEEDKEQITTPPSVPEIEGDEGNEGNEGNEDFKDFKDFKDVKDFKDFKGFQGFQGYEQESQACCNNCYNECCYVPRNWVSADYLLWWTKGNRLPPLVTGGPTGVLPASTILFGNQYIDTDNRDGIRGTIGHWCDPQCMVGWQATFYSVFDDAHTGDFSSATQGALAAGLPVLGRPFFNVDPAVNAPDARLISFPNIVAGSININSSSEMHSFSWNVRQHLRSGCKGRMDLLGGYRYFRFRDGMRIREDLVTTDPAGLNPVGTTLAIEDTLLAENDFHGGDMGFIAEFWQCGWSVEILAKVAMGRLRRSSDLYGSTVTTAPGGGAPVITNGGLLALPTNIGHHATNDFAALPEFGINAKIDMGRYTTFNLGYTLLMLNDVVRTGELIDTTINSTQLTGGAIVGTARPTSQIGNETDFWAQGLTFGLTITR